MGRDTCNCYQFISTCNGNVTYTDCNEEEQVLPIINGDTYNICSIGQPVVDCRAQPVMVNLGECIDGECPLPIVTTTTTFFPTPPTPVDPTNECDVLTIFPMEVNCFTTQPTFSDTYDGAVALGITGGTPPYTIIWKDGSVAPAKFNLGPGNYEATVTDYYGDFSVPTICVLTAETTTTTTTITPTTTQKVYNDYCLQLTTFSPKQQTTSQQNISLNYNGFYNDYPSWTANTPNVLVYWSADTTNSWIVSGLTSGTIVNSSYNDITTNDPLPLSNWQILGSTTIQNISITT